MAGHSHTSAVGTLSSAPRPLAEFVSDARLVGLLCRKRIALARRNRRLGFVARAAGVHDEPPPDDVLGLLPPRQHWPRLDRVGRRKADDLPAALGRLLARRVLRQLREDPGGYRWSRELRAFLDRCRERALGWQRTDVFRPERVTAIPKTRPGNREKYRVLVSYGLADSLVASVFSAYLRHLIDPMLDDACYAFRGAREGKRVTHHDAVDDLRTFASCISTKAVVWVAECDIAGFFDSVSHSVALRRLRALLGPTAAVDNRLYEFAASFLAGYRYDDARAGAIDGLKGEGISQPRIYQPIPTLKALRIPRPKSDPVGIPQGSSFSCILANVVLASADLACRRAIGGRPVFYARYCDDIVIVSTSRRAARESIRAYVRTLRSLRLPYHRLKRVSTGEARSAAFWSAKSKEPYRWTDDAGGARWIGFLGYQVRRDGALRVRRSSIQKEIRKQRLAVDHIIGRIDKVARKAMRSGRLHHLPTLRALEYSALMHLISIGVGYPTPYRIRPAANSVCWCGGFHLLRSAQGRHGVLRHLDRGRGRAIRVLRGRIRGLLRKHRNLKPTKSHRPPKGFTLEFDGRPLSYHAQFGGPTLPARSTIVSVV